MDFATIMQAISTIGFPCAMCIVLLIQMQNLSKQHNQEISMLTKYLNDNTLSVQKLTDRLEAHYENIRDWHPVNKEV